MTKLTNEIVNSTNGLSSGTYVVEDTIKLSQDLIIPNDVTLIFQGGKFEVADNCTKEIEIKGSDTRLEAPICNIFGKGINVEGSWDIDRACPQWFEIEKAINSCDSIKPYDDWSTSINKAIKMKQVGEVFLKNGDYSIASPIIMNCRIQLVGECSQWGDAKKVLQKVVNDETNEVEDKEVYESINGCTRIFPVAEGKSIYSDEYLLYVNAETDTKSPIPGMQYIDQSTLIKNICFTDFISKSEDHKFTQKCILAGGGVHLDRIVWYNFLQGVKYTHTYNDTKSITNCSFKYFGDKDTGLDEYAIDVSWLGDAFRFEHNALHQTITGKALRIDHCGGASIQGNIINGDVEIKGSKAIVFNANHCEWGMQLIIEDSSVVTNNNYFHKGTVPNITIKSSGNADKSVVSMNNDMFMFLETSVNEYNEAENKSTIRERIVNTSIYDICIDRHTILDITNVYRYESIIDFYKMYPCGISLCEGRVETIEGNSTTIYEPINEFNNYSYIASCKSQMLSNYCLNVQATIRDTKAPAISNVQHSNSICWFADGGTYRYYYQILWDETRGIKKTSSSTSTSGSIFPIIWYVNGAYLDSQEKEKTTETAKSGVAIGMPKDVNGNCSMVRLFRETTKNTNGINQFIYQYVDIPVCGTQYLYDNGISVSGYKWKSEGASSLFLQNTCDKNMEMFKINNGNVECFTKREGGITPTTGWKRGDVIHNIGSTPSTYIVPDDIAQ